MDFCTAHFGKNLNSLTLDDIKSYFNNDRIETDQIEFKSIHPSGSINDKFSIIQRSISAFLNSSGGLLIWGAPDGQKVDGKKEKVFKGALTYFSQVLEKDFVISKISDSIIPLPNNFRINILSEGNNSIVVLEIDASEYSPHQNANTYYMRIDGQTKTAPHHYIEALFKKISYPNIEAFIKITRVDIYQGSKCKVDFNMYFFNWTPLQNDEKLSFRVISDGVFLNSNNPKVSHLYSLEGHEYFKENAKEVFYFGEPVYENNTILFDTYELSQQCYLSKLMLSFGGKYSPRKTCIYELYLQTVNHSDSNNIIVSKIENKLSKDLQDEKGVTKESILMKLM